MTHRTTLQRSRQTANDLDKELRRSQEVLESLAADLHNHAEPTPDRSLHELQINDAARSIRLARIALGEIETYHTETRHHWTADPDETTAPQDRKRRARKTTRPTTLDDSHAPATYHAQSSAPHYSERQSRRITLEPAAGTEPTHSLHSGFEAAAYLRHHHAIHTSPQELFAVIGLDNRNRVLISQIVAQGTGNCCIIEPAHTLRPALLAGATRLIVAHNHPSYDPTPSQEDVELTSRIAKGAAMLGLEFLDSIVIASHSHRSLGGAQ